MNGPPGFGKTVLCAKLIEHLCSAHDSPLAYFFFSSEDFESCIDPFVAMRSWLTTLVSHSTAHELVREEWESQTSHVASRAHVVDMLRKVVENVPGCTLVLDGLDECAGATSQRDAQSKSISQFLESVQQAVANTNTRLLLVSRIMPEIRQSFLHSDGIAFFDYTISCDDVQTDVQLYARSIVNKKLHNRDETTKNEIASRLADRCNGKFLWVKLQEPSLRSGKNRKQIGAIIDSTPAALEQIYDRDWQKLRNLPPEESSRAVSLLRWVAFARRPLTISEITEAILVTDSCGDIVDDMPYSMDQEYVDGEILGLCGSLIEIRSATLDSSIESMTVHLAHFSVKEFFINKISAMGRETGVNEGLHISNEAEQNGILATSCLRYLNLPGVWQSDQDVSVGTERYFLDYAVNSWYEHAAQCKPGSIGVVRLTNAFFDEQNGAWKFWRKCYCAESYDKNRWSLLHFATLFRLTATVQFLIKHRTCNIDEQTSDNESALYISCRLGDAETAEVLLNAGADMSITDIRGHVPILTACLSGHVNVVRLLLENAADINSITLDGYTSLHLACVYGYVEIVELLISYGADLCATTEAKWTPLYLASHSGHLEVVKLLLEHEVAREETERVLSPLMGACRAGCYNVAKFLLENGSNVMAVDIYDQTALHMASSYGHVDIVRLLLEHGCPMDAVNGLGRSAFYCACAEGKDEVVEFLISCNVLTSTLDYYGTSPLFVATRKGHDKVVARLVSLCSGHDSLIGGLGKSLLWWAARSGNPRVMEAVTQLAKKQGFHSNEDDLPGPGRLPASYSAVQCDCCLQYLPKGSTCYHCPLCFEGDFDLCQECYETVDKCIDQSHKLIALQV